MNNYITDTDWAKLNGHGLANNLKYQWWMRLDGSGEIKILSPDSSLCYVSLNIKNSIVNWKSRTNIQTTIYVLDLLLEIKFEIEKGLLDKGEHRLPVEEDFDAYLSDFKYFLKKQIMLEPPTSDNESCVIPTSNGSSIVIPPPGKGTTMNTGGGG